MLLLKLLQKLIIHIWNCPLIFLQNLLFQKCWTVFTSKFNDFFNVFKFKIENNGLTNSAEWNEKIYFKICVLRVSLLFWKYFFFIHFAFFYIHWKHTNLCVYVRAHVGIHVQHTRTHNMLRLAHTLCDHIPVGMLRITVTNAGILLRLSLSLKYKVSYRRNQLYGLS